MSSHFTLKLTKRHETEKDARVLYFKERNKKTERYAEFFALSQSLMQPYLQSQCDGKSEDFLNYLRIHNEISITSDETVRVAASSLQHAVSLFIIQSEAGEIELIDKLRNNGREQVSIFQTIAHSELIKEGRA